MDAFDYADVAKASPPRSTSAVVWNLLTVLVLLVMLCLAGYFLLIFVNPFSAVNPLPPPTEEPLPTALLYPSATATKAAVMPATWTPTPLPPPSLTPTRRPTSTPFITETNTPEPSLTPTGGLPQASPTPGGFSFVVMQDYPKQMSNFVYPEAGCNWMGVGGQVFDLRGNPYKDGLIQLGGTIGGQLFDTQTTLTGSAELLGFGKGGFLFTISDLPVASNDTLWIQLFDQTGQLPLSGKITFDTSESCDKNLVLIYVKQVK